MLLDSSPIASNSLSICLACRRVSLVSPATRSSLSFRAFASFSLRVVLSVLYAHLYHYNPSSFYRTSNREESYAFVPRKHVASVSSSLAEMSIYSSSSSRPAEKKFHSPTDRELVLRIEGWVSKDRTHAVISRSLNYHFQEVHRPNGRRILGGRAYESIKCKGQDT